MSTKVNLPISKGLQMRYDSIEHKPDMLYICTDTGNLYIGDTPLGKDLLFFLTSGIPDSFGKPGDRCVTPSGIYIKTSEETNCWKPFSAWEINDDGILLINGEVPLATSDKPGFVKSSNKDGNVRVKQDGTMEVVGWENLDIVYRETSQ